MSVATDDRRAAVRAQTSVNGIDFLEVDPADPTSLVVTFIHNLPDAPTDPVPPDAGDALSAADFRVTGGERITPVDVVSAVRTADDQMTVGVDREGDFSTYSLTLATASGAVPAGFDPHCADVDFLFHVDCPSRFDCRLTPDCPPAVVTPPRIDYLAKDYPSFVRVMLDRLSVLAPKWQERHPADLGVALVEALAYVADHLSYRQDVVATEAYLGTARLRTSVARHARLVDYYIGQGNNARVRLVIDVTADVPGGLPKQTRFATSFGGSTGPFLARTPGAYQQAVSAGSVFFETVDDPAPLYAAHREMPLYNWSDQTACLAPGATSATLVGSFPDLTAGTVLVLAEKLGPLTGAAADADPAHRQAVRLNADAVLDNDLVTGTAVTEISWYLGDALSFPLCTASVTDPQHGEQPVTGVAVAWGNVVLADQGRSVGVLSDPLSQAPETLGVVGPQPGPRFRPELAGAPLTFAAPAPGAGQAASAATSMPVATVSPAVSAHSVDPDGKAIDWTAVRDLLATGIDESFPGFVAEVENDGSAHLRFGDGINGMAPTTGETFTATYRLGNGTAGNVARGAITLVDATDLSPGARADIAAVTNPLPAFGGVDPEPIEHVRQSAPVAFYTQKRAVTTDDYRSVAMAYPGVRRAAATFRWTGSWTTVFLTVEREAGSLLDPTFVAGLEGFVDGYRMAGFDLEVEDAIRTPLFVAMKVCVADGVVATDVEQALLGVFTDQVLPDGTLGMFHPDRLELGQPVYLSPLYARAQDIDGVASVHISRFERQAQPGDVGLKTGVLTPDRLELFVLANDPNRPEDGQFELTVGGGL